MKLITELNLAPPSFQLELETKGLALGSCFSSQLAQRLNQYKLPLLNNPFGVLYNPLSIASALELLLCDKKILPEELLNSQGLWQSLHFHSLCGGIDKKQTAENLNRRLDSSRLHFQSCQYLIISWGSAHVYEYKSNGQIAANCHKLPQQQFQRRRLSINEIQKKWTSLLTKLFQLKPDLKIIMTISPVRYLEKGARENSLSKAVLQLAMERLQNNFSQLDYFPACELLLDELRDYRFYADDLVHPSPLAFDYIFQKFINLYFDDIQQNRLQKLTGLHKALKHRPFHKQSSAYRDFCKRMLKKISQLEKDFPEFDFNQEKDNFRENTK